MDYAEYLRRLPKVELHCHVEGTLRPQTVADLAAQARHRAADHRRRPHLRLRDDLRVPGDLPARELDGDRPRRLRAHRVRVARRRREARQPQVPRDVLQPDAAHARAVSRWRRSSTGSIDGCAAAEHDFGVRCRLIADVYRQDSPAMALQMTEEVIANRRDELIGLGMDAAEAPDPPEKFVESFQLAGEAGLHLTSHASEDGPPANITTCLDLLGCERIDHGYHILEDDAVVERCRDDGIHFTCCPTSTAVVYGWPDLTTHPINGMMRRRAARAPQLRRPHDVPHRHRQGVRRLHRAERLPARDRQAARAQRRRRDLARRVGEGRAAPRCSTTRSPRSTRSSCGDPNAARTPIPRCDARGMRWRAATRSTERADARAAARRGLGARAPPDGAGGTTLAAFVDRCPHRLAPLSAGFGRRHDACAAATTAGASRPTGSCTEIPSLGDAASTCRRAPRRRSRPGSPSATAWCSSRPSRRSPSCSTCPRPTTPRSCTARSSRSAARVGAGLMIDNFLDMAHFPFVHAATIGTPESETFELRRSSATASACTCTAAHPFPNREDPGVARGDPAARPDARARVPLPRAVLDLPAHRLRRGRRHERARLLRAARRRRALPHLHHRAPQRPRRRPARAWPRRRVRAQDHRRGPRRSRSATSTGGCRSTSPPRCT